jgi:type IV pilus assembly protein PilM
VSETPFWKKEISLGRKNDGSPTPAASESIDELNDDLAQIKAAAVGDVEPETSVPEPVQAADEPAKDELVWVDDEEETAAEKVPFHKRSISLSRKPKAKKTKEPKAKRERKERSESTPFWKKEIGVGRKRTATATAKAEKPGKSEKGKKAEKPAKERKSGRKLALPKLERRPHRSKSGSTPKRLVGLKIGASQIAAARVSNNGAAELHQVARTELEHGIVVGGELREPEKLADALRDFFKETGLPKRGVRLGIANNRIGVRSFEIVGIADTKQLDNAIKFRAQEALPIPIDEAVIDYQILGETTNEEGEPVKRVLLVVAYRELVDRYVSACSKAGLELVGIDLEAFALLRAMAAPRADDGASNAALVVVSIGHERSTFAVSDGRVCEFTRVLEWGGSSLNVAIARALDLAPSEAEPWKRAFDLHATKPIEGLTDAQWTEMGSAVRRQVQTFARELVSSLQFYQNQPGSLGIGEIVLTGGTAHLPGLAEELQRLIGVSVRVGDPLARVRVNRKMADPEQVGSLAVAIGLAIDD